MQSVDEGKDKSQADIEMSVSDDLHAYSRLWCNYDVDIYSVIQEFINLKTYHQFCK